MIALVAAVAGMLTVAGRAHAALDVGERAPPFSAAAARDGTVYEYDLATALRRGPVVLYFFPAAYSEGCSAEAHLFAEAIPEFEKLGATVVGVSGDDIDTLARFSVQACQGRFPVASDAGQSVMRAYDAVLKTRPDFANRISYVIASDGRVVFHYMSLNPARHVERMLQALRTMRATKP